MSEYDDKYYLRQTQRGWVRKKHLVELKGGKCQVCGYCDCLRALSFHHRIPKDKKYNLDLRTIGNRKWSIILEEVEKCDLVCMNCHAEIHDKETCKKYLEYEKRHKDSSIEICINCGKDFKATYSLKGRGGGKYCSARCASVGNRVVKNRPNKISLEWLVNTRPTTKIAEAYNVSDKAVWKWCKQYGIEKPQRGFWTKFKNKLIEAQVKHISESFLILEIDCKNGKTYVLEPLYAEHINGELKLGDSINYLVYEMQNEHGKTFDECMKDLVVFENYCDGEPLVVRPVC